jgi:uncharacterized membrane protein required for colicin V production
MEEVILLTLIGIFVTIFGWLGFTREVKRGAIAIAGTLVGVIMAEFWAASWAQGISGSEEGSATLTAILSIFILLGTTILIGYGSGSIIAPRTGFEKHNFGYRVFATLIGMFNGFLVLSYVLRYLHEGSEAVRTFLAPTISGAVLIDGLRWVFLIVLVPISFVVLARTLLRMGKPARGPVVGPRPAPVMGKPTTLPPMIISNQQKPTIPPQQPTTLPRDAVPPPSAPRPAPTSMNAQQLEVLQKLIDKASSDQKQK